MSSKITLKNLQDQEFSIVHPDGAGAISIDSNKIMTKVTSTDNALVRFDGTTGAVQNSGVIVTDTGNLLVGTTTDNGVDKLQVNGSISAIGGINISASSEGIDTFSTNNILTAGLATGNSQADGTILAEITVPYGFQGLFVLSSEYGSILYFGGCFYDGGSNTSNLNEISRAGRTNNSYGLQMYSTLDGISVNETRLRIRKQGSGTTQNSHNVYFRAIMKN